MTDLEPGALALLRDLCGLDASGAGASSQAHAAAALLLRLQTEHGAWCAWLERHELTGYCFELLQDTGLEGVLLPDVRDRLASAHRRQVRHNERLLALLLALDAQLSEAGIPYLVIKGFPLSLKFAGGLHRRLMWDQDILIRPRDLGPVTAAAESLGLRAQAGAGVNPERLTRRLHAIELRDDKRKLDIHWVFRNRRGMRLSYEDVVDAAQPLILGGTEVQAASDLDLLAMSCLSLINDMERSAVRLRKVWDVYLMIAQMDSGTDWEAWLERPDIRPLRRTLLNVVSFCLALAAAEQDCPHLRASLDRHADLVLIRDRTLAFQITRRPRQSPVNRWLMARLQPVPALHFWAWWLGTLPIRYWHGRKL